VKIKMFKKIFATIIFAVILIFSGCDKGIEPGDESVPVGFSGQVNFVGTWPEGVKRTHLVVFKDEIKDTSDFFPPNMALVIDSILYNSKTFNYNSLADNFIPVFNLSAGSYKYVVVAQSKTETISLRRKDWYVAGVYCINGDQNKPATLTIPPGRFVNDINITVDFNNPPPQPPQ
jgi:hypothetical protein